MSVAFRREGDDEHLEPKFEIPIPPGPNLVTARGQALIAERVTALERQLAAAKDDEAVKPIKRDLRYWQTRQVTAELMPPPSGTVVEFGVKVEILHNGAPRSILVVGDDEADPAHGLLSFSAPLSRALMGAEPGDILAFGGKEDAIEVLSIAPIG